MKYSRDSQRSAVYAWERTIRDIYIGCVQTGMTLAECQALVDKVWSWYQPKGSFIPVVTDGRGRRSAGATRHDISIPRRMRNNIVVLHEVGHSLIEANWNDIPYSARQPVSPHGREFARLALDLYARFAKLPKAEIRREGVRQRPRRVRFASPHNPFVPKPLTKGWRAWRIRSHDLHEQLQDHHKQNRSDDVKRIWSELARHKEAEPQKFVSI